jgi:galactokinase
MTGAGFGGCALALLENKNFEEFVTKVSQRYQQKTNYLPQIYKVYPSDGGKITMI